ncbi:hypothetical protein [Marimonas arenosa]|uniref:Uncharacterized protein n=1 Tax=Marimonas arenosa TaxID=1795305 RepID=A0AAE4B5Q4_9RHOB|nr:hypothetical protein [Marimonas arenosa]MDQ2089511.1 hypothetical protein [Marimonas arenosa]
MTRSLTIILITCMLPVMATAQAPRMAALTVTGQSTCTHTGAGVDRQSSEETVTFTLPASDGPVSGQGTYTVRGTLGPYVLSGINAVSGHVRDDSELVLTYLQWNYNGEWMPSESPFVPTQGQPVIIPLEPGGETVVQFTNAGPAEAPCTGKITYRLDFERETQVWQVAMPGHVRIVYHNLYAQVDPATGAYMPLNYTHGFTFQYQLGAEVTLEKRKGNWSYKSGKVTQAQVVPEYEQAPPLYKVLGQSCERCAKVAALKGSALSGTSDGKTLQLGWPDIRPVATVDSKFAMKCAPGPHFSTCQNNIKYGTSFSIEDGYFLDRAGSHILALKDGPDPKKDGKAKATSTLDLRHNYTLKRLK